MGSQSDPNLVHIFLVSFPGQGHVNPLLRLGKIIASRSPILVTLSAPELIGREIKKANNIQDDQPSRVGEGWIRFEFFDDEWALDGSKTWDLDAYLNHLELIGREKLPKMLKKHEEKGSPVSCIIVNPFLPWVSDVAQSLDIPSATLWVQSCASFASYYHYYHGLVPFPTEDQPKLDVQIPGMPLLKYDEVPTFLIPGNPYPYLGRAILGQYKYLSKNFCVLMDTFYELEQDVIDQMSMLCPIKPIGPMFRIPKDSTSKISGDVLKADDCKEWLDSKPNSSVVYISFGSIVFLKKEQMIEMAYGILNSGVNFLWVVKPPAKELGLEPHVLPEDFLEKVVDKGKIVQWSPQEQVLAHPSVACFVTHCGWNSTLEAISSGVPVVAFPQWGDQVIDAKYLVDEFKVGIRMCRGEAENRIIPREEVEECLREATSGPRVAEMRENALKWKKKAEAAVANGGSSERNVLELLEEVKMRRRVVKY